MQRVSELDVADTGAESLPRDSQPSVKVQEKQNERSSGASFAMRSTKREVFSVKSGRSQQWREEGRQRNWSGGEGRRRDRSGAGGRRREGEKERETHTRETAVEMEEQGDGTKKNSLGKGDRNSELLTETNDQQRRQRNRERQCERNWRAKGRSDDKKTEREKHFAKQSRGGAVKKEVIDGQQKTNRDASEKFVSDGSHSNAPARQRGGLKSTRNRARDMDRNWSERPEDDDTAKNEATGSVKKHEAMQPVTEGLQKLTREEGRRETEKKQSKKSGRSAPKKTSHPEGIIIDVVGLLTVSLSFFIPPSLPPHPPSLPPSLTPPLPPSLPIPPHSLLPPSPSPSFPPPSLPPSPHSPSRQTSYPHSPVQ